MIYIDEYGIFCRFVFQLYPESVYFSVHILSCLYQFAPAIRHSSNKQICFDLLIFTINLQKRH